MLAWIRDWLKERKQRDGVNDEYSEWIDILSSVVRGSVPGGILFDLFIDLVVIMALILKYADDTKVAKIDKSLEEARQMQQVIDKLVDKWGMEFDV